uniref:transposase n=1 Tax=Wolbachia endosymbiont (group A) of Anoplius nigerrimus TaxID=2953979 RepID=UPI002231E721|nr:transposase [Wolbachia endosymbiont (group A) of Anoplius nigerrimus]
MPQKMKVSNQNEYNKFLQERGNIFHYINEAIENWYENSPKMQGGNYIYSDKVVILVHIIVNLFRIGLRQTVGFIKGYLQQIGRDLQLFTSIKRNLILKSMIAELIKII